ncbi:hypothetical protein FB451DRAFT_308435 [Mycena latifolia]|nr:hypothetical protein FB451DRAFT_308435 [Mycena latifolia]
MGVVKAYLTLNIYLLSGARGAWSYQPRAVSSGSADSNGFFNDIAEMTTCTPATISWIALPGTVASGLKINLTMTNAGISQSPLSSSASDTSAAHSARAWHRSHRYARGTVTQQIASDIDASLGTYTWASVNVSAGWYSIIATGHLPGDPGIAESNAFFVVNGADTSCLGTASRSISSPSAAGTSLAPATARHDAEFPPGAIAGIVVGAILVLVAGILVFLRIRSQHARARIFPVYPFQSQSGGTVSDKARASTVLTLDVPMAAGVVESQEQMFRKIAHMQDDMRALERDGEGSDTPGVAEQLRAMAERVALMEARVQMLVIDHPIIPVIYPPPPPPPPPVL